jgi:ComF family protein
MNWLYELWDDFISLLFPRLCFACGNHLVRNESLICTACYVSIPRTDYHLNADNPVAQLFWGRCLIERAAAFSYYAKGSRIRNLIHKLKYSGIKEIGYELGRIYGSSLKSSGFLSGIDLLIPVPLHPSKKRMRGFNQSEYISAGVSDVTGLPLSTGCLVRTVLTATQTNRSRYDRWTNVEGIFRVAEPGVIRGKHVLIVDDVITTGSTIESCVNELLKVEDVKVSVIAIGYAVE